MESTLSRGGVSQRRIFLTYLPLAAMWIMMGIEQPGLNAVIARMSDAPIQLAAFGVTFALALVVESPIIQMLSAGTAVTYDRRHYRRLLRVMHFFALTLTTLHIILAIPPIYDALMRNVAGVPERLIGPSREAFTFMIPWAAAVGYRRLWQGVLIRHGRAKVVPITMVVRLVATGLGLVLGYFFDLAQGATVAAASIILGVVAGAVASYLYVRPVVKGHLPEVSEQELMSYGNLLRFYLPLAATSVMVLASRPIITVGIARSPMAMESLALWPVLDAFNFLLLSLALALQEAVIALLRTKEDLRQLRRFTLRLAAVLAVVYFAVALLPLRDLWFLHVAGLTPELVAMIPIPLLIIAVFPSLGSFTALFRGILVQQQRTPRITKGMAYHVAALILMLLGGVALLSLPGVVTAAIAFTGSLFVEVVYLGYYSTERRLDLPEGSHAL
ncbi:MAG: hypothetical protein ACOCYG_01325 [Spirochaetota bacterium]